MKDKTPKPIALPETVKRVTEQLEALIEQCNQDPAYHHPLKDDPNFVSYEKDPIRKDSLWPEFNRIKRYKWQVIYEEGRQSSTSTIIMEYDPKTKVFSIDDQTTQDPEQALRLYTKEVEKIKESRK